MEHNLLEIEMFLDVSLSLDHTMKMFPGWIYLSELKTNIAEREPFHIS